MSEVFFVSGDGGRGPSRFKLRPGASSNSTVKPYSYMIFAASLPFFVLCACGEPQPDPIVGDESTLSETPEASREPDSSPSPSPSEAPTSTPEDSSQTPEPSSPTPIMSPTPEASPSPTPIQEKVYSATIRQTEYGIPHILADDYGSLGFGEGYAFAGHNMCILADQVLKVRSERARYLGAGEEDANLDSDFAYLALNVYPDAEEVYSSLSPEVQALLEGYAAGYNKYILETPTEDWPPDCADADWVKPISEIDLLAYYNSLAMLAFSDSLIPGIARAQPPTSELQLELPPTPNLRHHAIGSNGWGIGGDRTLTGDGMVVANPHFPWEGQLKFFESQLTIPGELNVYGVSLMGVPVINIGFNEHIAWTHTFSWATRGTMYRIQLDPRDPTHYFYDEEIRSIKGRTFTISVKLPGDIMTTVSRTLYRSHYGPMVATEDFGWSSRQAITVRDANEGNPNLVEHFLQVGRATDLESFKAVQRDVHGIPWAYSMFADQNGDAFFTDSSVVPKLSEQTLNEWMEGLQSDPLTILAWELGAPLLDGGNSANEWVKDEDGRDIVPFSEAPQLERRDFALNSNDSHWLANPAEPLEGFPLLYGDERAPRSPRSRMNLKLLLEEGEGSASGLDHLFTLDELQTMALCNRGIMGELLRRDVVKRCNAQPRVVYEGTMVDISSLCSALSTWDGRTNLESRGAVTWREFMGSFDEADREDAGPLFKVAFDPDDPVNTPNTLAPVPDQGNDPVTQALASVKLRLDQAGFAPNVALGDAQYTLKNDERIPIHGGQEVGGAFSTVYYTNRLDATLLPSMEQPEVIYEDTDLTEEGYLVNYGTSFLMVVEMTPEGPEGRAITTYSQSNDSRSPYYSDQTHMFSEKEWREIRFTEEEIEASPDLQVIDVR